MQFKGKGNKLFHADHAGTRRSAAQSSAALAELRDRPRRPALLVPDDRLHPVRATGSTRPAPAPRSPASQSPKEAQNLALVLQTGALPVKFVTVERTDVSATLGKDSLKQARNAAIGGLIVVALFLLFLYRFLGLVAVIGLAHLRGVHVRRDPALRRHADAAGLRRPDPDDRRRGRRERRHLRTHQGRGARRADRCARRSPPATRRASARSSTRTSSRRSPR